MPPPLTGLATTTGEGPTGLADVLDAWFLFGTLIALLVAFVIGLLLIQALRRRRTRRVAEKPAAALPDPWVESARRVKP